MAGKKKGYADNVPGMRHRRKGGQGAGAPDGFDRSTADTLANLADAWLAKLGDLAYSPRSLASYRWAMKSFLAWCAERDLTKPCTITKKMLESHARHLARARKSDGQPLSVTTRRARLGNLQRFFAHLCKEDHIPANPAADLDLPRKQPRLLPKALSAEEIVDLLARPDTGDVLGLRDRCILEVLYSCALRRSEVVKLDLEDLDRAHSTLTVRQGKGGKSRVVPVGGRALGWLVRYLEESRPRLELHSNERALFLSGYGERMSGDYVGNWVSKQIKAAGIEKAGSCHLLRHSCATHMLEGGADIRYIQQMLGHARLDTTQIYTEVSILALREIHAKTHPHGQADPPQPSDVA